MYNVNSMIIKIQGGLGNQMFQYAYGRNLELLGKKVVFDISFFNHSNPFNKTRRNFGLNIFNIKTKCEFSRKERTLLFLIRKILSSLKLVSDGFYQSEKYFEKITKEIREEFVIKVPLTENTKNWIKIIEENENSVSLHIRRGDYASNKKTNSFHGICEIEYYKKALKMISGMANDKNISVFVFSDDVKWTKEIFESDIFFISNNVKINLVSDSVLPDYEEIYLMSKCKNNIISNSTFSWWGAWLNKNPNKIIIAPKQWLKSKTCDQLEILPKNWIQI